MIIKDVFGTISLSASKPAAFTEDDLSLLTSFAATASAALHNAILYAETQNLATRDPLTGKLNRRTLFEYGQREVDRYRRFGHKLSALMFDIDHFKQINDRFGHSTGDKVLMAIADRCGKVIRNVDILGRYGGDEFAVLLPEADISTASDIANRIRTSILQSPVPTEAGKISVSVSIGVAQADVDITKFAALLHKADQALYQSKQSGRNRTTLAI
jgi:diguanylate cyclase (GGDEF)-like protein